jgi:hypothetical protein
MIARIVLSVAFAAIATRAQTERPATSAKAATATPGSQAGSAEPPKNGGVIPRHIAEPIVIRDSSVKVDIYATSDAAVEVEKPDTVITDGVSANKGTVLVPTRVVRVRTGPGGRTVVGKLQLRSARAHPTINVRRYVYEVEKFEDGKFVPYAELVFQSVKSGWRISPSGSNPLKLICCGAPVALAGAWANHFQSSCEYGYRDLHLRLGSVTIEPLKGAPSKMSLATGCSEFRIEPILHPPHRMTFDHTPCAGVRLDPTVSYPRVLVKGVHSITAIDVSLAKVKSKNESSNPDSQK